ncbi:MAG: GNAT family N-acetyltransferase [Desulfobacteraceae bacterium 4572_35.1]|nr:MAG: GNAT family N-acetyltransferase [Desulfobacteraceae bacterium 4572_35.1]
MIRKAHIDDATAIQKLLVEYASHGLMLSRSLAEIYQAIRSFYVIEQHNKIVGIVSLQIWWLDLAEVRSLVVTDELSGQGCGRKLVQLCLDEAKELGLKRVFALTYQEEFFSRLGFKVIEKSELPQKIWGDCMQCPKFPNCDEIAMAIDVEI